MSEINISLQEQIKYQEKVIAQLKILTIHTSSSEAILSSLKRLERIEKVVEERISKLQEKREKEPFGSEMYFWEMVALEHILKLIKESDND